MFPISLDEAVDSHFFEGNEFPSTMQGLGQDLMVTQVCFAIAAAAAPAPPNPDYIELLSLH